MNATAKNFEAIAKARDRHNANCEFPAHTVVMNQHDIERLGWTEGDTIAGLRLVAGQVQSDCFQLLCDKNKPSDGPEIEETVEAVSEQREPVAA